MSTLTPESSEAPRESLTGEALYGGPAEGGMGSYGHAIRGTLGSAEEQAMINDALVTGNGFMRGGKRVDPAGVYQSTKTSSPELASLAAKYVNMNDDAILIRAKGRGSDATLCEDIRSLAASVLAQVEGTPRK